MFSPKYDCDAFGFVDGQEGLFYDPNLNILLKGKITDYMLDARVEHDGTDYENGCYFAGFTAGYRYKDWDLHSLVHFPNDILTLDGYLKWLNNPKIQFEQIKAYFKAKRLLVETLTPRTK